MRNELLKSWSESQFDLAEQKIAEYFFESISNLGVRLGLAYTSSSAFAALWVCHKAPYFDKQNHFKIRGFALDKMENLVIYCEDINENELFVTIK